MTCTKTTPLPTLGEHRHDGAATMEQPETMVAWLIRPNMTVPTCGERDTCATVRMERLPQGKPGGYLLRASRNTAGARALCVTILHDKGA
jgi:hypothetical protein